MVPRRSQVEVGRCGNRSRPIVVANGAEGEPASRKDATLLLHAPHLVLDGLVLAARALRAKEAIAYVPASSLGAVDRGGGRTAPRPDPGSGQCAAPDTFIAGQESAAVNALGGRGAALPSFVGIESVRVRGVRGRPTLVHNVETLAHVALIARFGAAWFKGQGRPTRPGTMLLTVNRPSGQTVVEAALGSPFPHAAGLGTDEVRAARGFLLGGYGGGWVTPSVFAGLALSEKEARRAGATLGAGIVAVLPGDVCPLAEAADVVRFLEAQGAGQCGPCVHGLSELARRLERVAYRPDARRANRSAARAVPADRGAWRLPPPRRRGPVRADGLGRVRRRASVARTRSALLPGRIATGVADFRPGMRRVSRA